jgi:hypothetical protein
MNAALLALALTLAQSPITARQPHPLAPSLPTLTKEEEKRYDLIIERFILADTGRLTGPEAKKAMDDFKALRADAFFNLVNGFNRAAEMEHSCPAVLIGKKLMLIIHSSSDLQLLAFARENLGAGVSAKRHAGVISDLRAAITFRRGAVQRAQLASGTNGSAMAWDKLTPVLLTERMAGQPAAELKKLLVHPSPTVRIAAIQSIQQRGLKYGPELIERLTDADFEVVTAARRALVQLARGQDFGPASQGERDDAVARWKQWLHLNSK